MNEKDYRMYKNAIAREQEVMHKFMLGELDLSYKDFELCEQALYFIQRDIRKGSGKIANR